MSKCVVLIGMSEDTSIGIVATIPASTNIRYSILSRIKKYFSFKYSDRFWNPLGLQFDEYQGFFLQE